MSYVVELLQANDGDIDGKCIFSKMKWFRIFISSGVIGILCIQWFKIFIYIQW